MKPTRFAVAALLFLSGTIAGRANLGETEAQCIAHYGAEFDSRDSVGYNQVGDRLGFFHQKTPTGSFDVRIVFLNSASCHETYTNTDSAHGLTMDQMKAILDAQSVGLKWRKGASVFRTGNIAGETYGSIDWLRSDGATAKFWVSGKANSQTQTGQVELSTKQYADAQRVYDRENGGN
jgi:hypothetical protein